VNLGFPLPPALVHYLLNSQTSFVCSFPFCALLFIPDPFCLIVYSLFFFLLLLHFSFFSFGSPDSLSPGAILFNPIFRVEDSPFHLSLPVPFDFSFGSFSSRHSEAFFALPFLVNPSL